MTAFQEFQLTAHRALAGSKITRVFETKVFYVIRGRNAWHSTWVTHYFERCMHPTLWSAKQRTEELREQGSTFTIREQPAVCFSTDKGQILVTEINNSVPLLAWIKDHKKAPNGFQLNHEFCALERLLQCDQSARALSRAFDSYDFFPGRLPSRAQHIFILATKVPDACSEDRRSRLKQWNSRSQGTDYYLEWIEDRCPNSGRAVRRIADALAGSLPTASIG
jgi:hypothetical protein